MWLPFAVTLLAAGGIAGGVWLTGVPALSRRLVPFSGGLLIGIALFWVLPEMAEFFSWPGAMAWIAAGFLMLWLIDRFIYPVCPACSHTHDHDQCSTRLHGFATPLLLAAGLHSFLDGWTLAVGQQGQDRLLGTTFVIGIALHKIPEGLALGVIVRAALASRGRAVMGAVAAESATLVGAGVELLLAPYLGSQWVNGLLALAAGTFLYLGFHAVHGEFKRRGIPAFMPALTGVAGSSVIRLVGTSVHRFW